MKLIDKIKIELQPEGTNRLTVLGLMLMVVILPFGGIMLSWSLIVCVLLWMVDNKWKLKTGILKRNSWFWLFVGLYLFALAGYPLSQDKDVASFKLLQKIVLILLPLSFATIVITSRDKLLQLFTYAIAFNCLVLELRAVNEYISYGDTTVFFYKAYCYFIHPSYFALLVSIALLISLIRTIKYHSPQKKLWFVFSLFFSINVLQSSSRAGMLGLIIVWLIVLIVMVRHNRTFAWKPNFILLLILLITILLAYILVRQTRLTTLQYAQHMENVSPANAESGQVRLLIWEEVIDLIKQQPLLGYGTGDVNLILDKSYARLGMTGALKKQLNVHNQYLQTALANGVLALLILLSILFIGILQAIRQNDYIALGFFLLMGFHLIFESMLERREGLFTFAFFAGLFLCKSVLTNHEKSSSPKLS